MIAKVNIKTQQSSLGDIGFGTLFRLKKHRIHGGGKGAVGIVLGIDGGKRWDNYSRQLVVTFEDTPNGRYRLSVDDIILEGGSNA